MVTFSEFRWSGNVDMKDEVSQYDIRNYLRDHLKEWFDVKQLVEALYGFNADIFFTIIEKIVSERRG